MTPPTPYLADADVTLWHGDALDVLRGMESDSVDCVVTSPPYWGLRDYGNDGQLGLEETPDLFVAAMVAVFREVRRVLCPHGTCWVNLGSSFANKQEQMIPQRVALALQAPYYTGRIKSETDRVWLAATVEAEGCMFIHRRKAGQPNGQGYHRKNDSFGAGLEVASTDRVIVERCMEIAGIGSICEQSPDQNARRKQTIYRWNVRSNECRWIIGELYPHLIAKQHEARLLIGCPSSGDDARKAWESLKALHQGQTASIDFQPPEGMWERGWFLRSEIIWAKCMPNPMPESVTDRPTKSHEYVFLLTKQPRYFFDQEAVREPAAESVIARAAYAVGGTKVVAERNDNGRAQERTYADYAHGRNVRSVWTIATQPYPEAHFATYPEELVRRCVLAGCPERVCRTCGKASERLVETSGGTTGQSWGDHTNDAVAGNFKTGGKEVRASQGFGDYKRDTVGWSDCGHNDWRPGRVLDPFVGSGTTCLVARNHGRHSVGIDLNEQYLELAATRLQQLSLLSEPALSPTGSAEP